MTAPLVLAVPSKGRLQENANAFFTRAGLPVQQAGSERSYRGSITGLGDVEIAYLSASEITRELAAGTVHLGVTGRDLVEEEVPDFAERLDLVLPLGFGHADVVVAVPEGWIDVRSMADLDDVAADFRPRHGRWLTVATKYVNLTRRFFHEHGIADYRIVESLGATEGAPASGAADLIVDITTTGSTLAANALKVIGDGVILRSEAHLVASIAANWSGGARGALRTILDRIEAEAAGRSLREIRADVSDGEGAAMVAHDRFGATAPFGTGHGPLTLHCPASKVYQCAEWLRTGAGARSVTVTRLDMVFSATSPLAARLLGRLDGQMPA
ncbi:ATP phosphoribosyltransferase [Mesorhizobium sp. BR1-1-16]|uniref:ATP phosphoribosyltransferase n=1 Tax=Mesorhizobium sp. BR1-1-16 TaxID=2876653 RepID=UPI001CCF0999|nr:ATP phosphoribosyltransferase [Mesorhizobium sp. BR1-1-16]MBZ9934720.1 ATP phosphoribosyltransferase [Mesorhizobium sp. BR1-1-16]